jgi:hypothetical protein
MVFPALLNGLLILKLKTREIKGLISHISKSNCRKTKCFFWVTFKLKVNTSAKRSFNIISLYSRNNAT